ncbi:hypothetical protein WN944_000996 [Citrus x changshan-huyou]|uniref:Uncharacterized protein n=1 Tax=Citrus x changshan-huyou TaxID=2935761 RepID=A0AAP0MIE0_9ROSI
MFCFNCVATFSSGTSPLGNAECGKQGVVVEKVVLITIGTSEGGTTIPVVDLSKAQASELLKSKVPRLPYLKRKADPRKNYSSKKAKSCVEFIPRIFLLVTISIIYFK